jgi:hypothetical protein
MSRLVIHTTHRHESAATTIVDLSPGQPVRQETPGRVVEGIMRLERPLPMAALVRHVLTRYGLELAASGDTDCQPNATEEVVLQPERQSLRA